MTVWIPDPAPFGNASGLDYVSMDVKACIAHRLGAHVTTAGYLLETTGRMLPDDIGSDVDHRHPSDQARRQDPFAYMTVSVDGLTVSGEDRDGNGHTSGYRSSYWFSRMAADTVIFDLRPMDWDDAVKFAVRGPMCNPSLPPGTVSKMGEIPDILRPVADDYLREVGGLAAVLLDEERKS